MLPKSTRLSAVFLGLILLSCSRSLSGPSAAAGSNLAGTWVSDEVKFDVPGGSPLFRIEFRVDASSRTVSDVVWRPPGGGVSSAHPGTATIENGRFKFEQRYEGSCNGNRRELTMEVVFRSEREADGKWSGTAVAPPGYSYCGASSGDFKTRRQ